jgi:hypothetical protein
MQLDRNKRRFRRTLFVDIADVLRSVPGMTTAGLFASVAKGDFPAPVFEKAEPWQMPLWRKDEFEEWLRANDFG